MGMGMGMGMAMTMARAWASVNGNEGNCTVQRTLSGSNLINYK